MPIVRLLVLLAALATAVACGESGVQPIGPVAPTPGPTEDLVVRMSVQVDAGAIRDAVAGFSQVAVDASGSTGPEPLAFTVDFGDGFRSTSARASHVYSSPGAFTVTTEVRDAQGRVVSRTQAIVVKRLVGSWFHLGYNTSTKRAEVQRLDVQNQDGATIRGIYRRTGEADSPFTSTLRSSRDIQIIAGATTLGGTIPNNFTNESEPWRLEVRGNGYGGERLGFRAVVGEPVTPAPDARLTIRTNTALARVAFAGLTDIDFDGSASTGDGLSQIIEFGDDQFAEVPRASHSIDSVGSAWEHTARLTVMDRFGRVNSESMTYAVVNLTHAVSFNANLLDVTIGLTFHRRVGRRYEGTIGYRVSPNEGALVSCVAVMSGERDVVITVDSLGIEFRGYVDLSRAFYNPTPAGTSVSLTPPLVVTQRGGTHDGRTWTLSYNPGF